MALSGTQNMSTLYLGMLGERITIAKAIIRFRTDCLNNATTYSSIGFGEWLCLSAAS